MSISKHTYDALKEAFGQLSSWAVWDEPDPLGKPKSNLGTQVFDSINLSELNTAYVFVGLNPANHGTSEVKPAWSSFHSEYAYGNDYILRGALNKAPFRGSYLTDLIKDYIQTDGGKVKKLLKEKPEILQENLVILRRELDLLQDGKPLDQKPVLVAMDGEVEKYLKKYMKDYTVKRIYHFAFSHPPFTPESYRKHVEERLLGH